MRKRTTNPATVAAAAISAQRPRVRIRERLPDGGSLSSIRISTSGVMIPSTKYAQTRAIVAPIPNWITAGIPAVTFERKARLSDTSASNSAPETAVNPATNALRWLSAPASEASRYRPIAWKAKSMPNEIIAIGTMKEMISELSSPTRLVIPFSQTISIASAAPASATAQYDRNTTPTTISTAMIVNVMNGPAVAPSSWLVRLVSIATPWTLIAFSSPRSNSRTSRPNSSLLMVASPAPRPTAKPPPPSASLSASTGNASAGTVR